MDGPQIYWPNGLLTTTLKITNLQRYKSGKKKSTLNLRDILNKFPDSSQMSGSFQNRYSMSKGPGRGF